MMKRRKRIVLWIAYTRRWKWVMTALCVIALIGLLIYERPAVKTWETWSLPLSGKVIVLDAGHGGPDGGAVSKDGAVEKEINLIISHLLRDYLQQAGALVYMTREDDRDLADPNGGGSRKRQDLHRRIAIVHQHQAQVFISVHMNSIPSSRWYGAQTFYDPHQHADSKQLSLLIQDEFKQTGKTTREVGTKQDVFLLKASNVPSALVEVGFLSNPAEAQLLQTSAYQRMMSEAIYRGILRFLSGEKLGSVS